MEISQEEYNALKTKATKWDALDEKIGSYYPGDEDDDDAEGDLGDIGEAAATAFGYM